MKLILNNKEVETSENSGTVLLDFIREIQHLPGTKEGCREGECGACTVLIGELRGKTVRYKAVASCLYPLGDAEGKHVVTVEGLNSERLTAVQQAIIDDGATQCGFCTPGIVLSLTGFFLTSRDLSCDDALDALDGNVCRCTGYVAIRNAAKYLADYYGSKIHPHKDRLPKLVELGILPPYFNDIPERLKTISVSREVKGTKDSVLVGGGTDLFVQRPDRLLDESLSFLSARKDIEGVERKGDVIFIGGNTTVEDMKRNDILLKIFPRLKDDLNRISSTIMRNRATIAGNFVNASPIGDLSIFFLALSSVLIISGKQGRREVALKDFFLDYKKLDLNPGEIIEWVKFDSPEKGRFHFEKVSHRTYLDIASCNSACYIETEGAAIKRAVITAGGVGPIPMLLAKTSDFITGKEVSSELVREAAEMAMAEVSPISDGRGTAEYKKEVLKRIIYAHFIEYFPEKIKYEMLI